MRSPFNSPIKFDGWYSAKNFMTNGRNISDAITAAILFSLAKGDVSRAIFIEPGEYDNWNLANIVIMPSFTYIFGVRGQTIIKPDMTTLPPDKVFPLATGAMIMTGDPATGNRAGINSGQTVDPATVVQHTYVEGLTIDNSALSTPIPAGYHLTAIQLWFSHHCGIKSCDIINMPNTGAYLAGYRHGFIDDCFIDDCGHLTSEAGALNGISTPGWIDTAEANSSQGLRVTNNTIKDSRQIGIQNSTCKGVIITDNILIGVQDYAIEGEAQAPATTATTATYGYEVPADTIVSNNYIDGYSVKYGTYGNGGITWGSSNQGKYLISNNVIKNTNNTGGTAPGYGNTTFAYTSGSPITCRQNNNGVFKICDNEFYNCIPGSTGAHIQIATAIDTVEISNNKASGSSGGTFIGASSLNAKNIVIENNHSMNGTVSRFCDLSLTAGSGGTLAMTQVRITDNSVDGATLGSIVLRYPNNSTVARVLVKDNNFLNINSTANTSEGFIRITAGTPTYSLAMTDLVTDNNNISYAGNTQYPIMFDSTVAAGAITNLFARNNNFGTPVNKSLTNRPLSITNLQALGNGYPNNPLARSIATGNLTMTDADDYIEVTGGSGNITLPSTGTTPITLWKPRTIKGKNATNNITVIGTVDGTVNPTITTAYGSLTVAWDGTSYTKIGGA